jgi:hypothetical protein
LRGQIFRGLNGAVENRNFLSEKDHHQCSKGASGGCIPILNFQDLQLYNLAFIWSKKFKILAYFTFHLDSASLT